MIWDWLLYVTVWALLTLCFALIHRVLAAKFTVSDEEVEHIGDDDYRPLP